jgi:hypothetical protein
MAWDFDTARRIEWFKTATLPVAPFQFKCGVKITDSAKWRAYLENDIREGSKGARARTGALQADLEQLEKIIVHGLVPPATNPVYKEGDEPKGVWVDIGGTT